MTQVLKSLIDIAPRYDVIVFDQWGVLHDGTSAYVGAVAAINALGLVSPRLGVLSNSGKRAAPNAERIGAMGFDVGNFDHVITSGEALWQDLKQGVIPQGRFFPVERSAGDAVAWSEGLDINIVDDVRNAHAILLMGLPDGADMSAYQASLNEWASRGLPVYCSNPDRKSPRTGGHVMSPGALAFAYRDAGGEVVFYGKPHLPIFRSMETAMGPGKYLMVGDSLEHDIAGAQTAGWDSLLIQGGLYRDAFAADPGDATLDRLVAAQGCDAPTFRMKEVQ